MQLAISFRFLWTKGFEFCETVAGATTTSGQQDSAALHCRWMNGDFVRGTKNAAQEFEGPRHDLIVILHRDPLESADQLRRGARKNIVLGAFNINLQEMDLRSVSKIK